MGPEKGLFFPLAQLSLARIPALIPARTLARALLRGSALALLIGVLACGGAALPTPTPEPAAPPDSRLTSGISEDGIIFGQSAALSGPAQGIGANMRLGILAAFDEVNRNGGVHGRRLELTTLDDAYEPEEAARNANSLIEEQDVFALIGGVGAPASRSMTPIAASNQVPFVAPFSGASFLRERRWDNIINLRASYDQEAEAMVERLTADLGIERVAVLYQDDAFGRAGYNSAVDALDSYDLEPVSVGLFPRNSTAIKTALIDISKGNPEAVILIGAHQSVAAFVRWAKDTALINAEFIAVSFAGANALEAELGAAGAGVFATQVVPLPTDASLPVVASYNAALSAYDPAAAPGFVSLEGYLAGRLVIDGLNQCGRNITRTCFLQVMLSRGSFDIDGFRLEFSDSSTDNQGSDNVFLTVIGSDGNFHPIETLRDSVN